MSYIGEGPNVTTSGVELQTSTVDKYPTVAVNVTDQITNNTTMNNGEDRYITVEEREREKAKVIKEDFDCCPVNQKTKTVFNCFPFLVFVEMIITITALASSNLGTAYGDDYNLRCMYQATEISYSTNTSTFLQKEKLEIKGDDFSSQLCGVKSGFCWDRTSDQMEDLHNAGITILSLLICSLFFFLASVIIIMLRCIRVCYYHNMYFATASAVVGWVIKVIGIITWTTLGHKSCYAIGKDDESYIGGHSASIGQTIILSIPFVPLAILLLLLWIAMGRDIHDCFLCTCCRCCNCNCNCCNCYICKD